MFTRDHSRRRSRRPAAAQIDTFAIAAHIVTTTTRISRESRSSSAQWHRTAWTMLEFDSFNALHDEPSASNHAIRLQPDLTNAEISGSAVTANALPLLRPP